MALKCGESIPAITCTLREGLLACTKAIAEKYFGKVVAIAPKSQLAASSKAWLALLQQPTPGNRSWPEAVFRAPVLAEVNTSLAVTTDRLVRDLLDQDILIQQLRASRRRIETIEALQRELTDRGHKVEALLSKKDSARTSADPVSIHSAKQLTERDRKIEELLRNSNIEAN